MRASERAAEDETGCCATIIIKLSWPYLAQILYLSKIDGGRLPSRTRLRVWRRGDGLWRKTPSDEEPPAASQPFTPTSGCADT